MFGEPRCREWTPLATQQLRLRSLIQIVGYNIRPPERVPGPCSYYYTLHATTMSAPFHTSERVASPHPKWREIDSEIIQRTSSQNMVVRIWCHSLNAPTPDAHTPPPTDKIIQTWGVYFSGLLHIGANLAIDFTADSFKQNTLVFQMHGGYFCSYKSLRLDAVNLTNSQPTSSSSSAETNKSQMIPIEARFMQNHYRFNNPTKESKSISPNKNNYYRHDSDFVSKSQSPPSSGGFRQSFAKIRSTGSLNINQNRTRSSRIEEDCSLIFEHSPKDSSDIFTCDSHDKLVSLSREDLSKSEIDLSESADLYIKGNDDMPLAKCRYSSLNFLKSEIRPSYNSLKLQKLHLLQFSIKKRKEAVEEIKQRIYQKSAMDGIDQYGPSNVNSEGSEQIRCKSRTQKGLFEDDFDKDKDSDSDKGLGAKSPSKNGRIPASDVHFAPNDRRFTLSLNKLLEFKSRPSPHQRWEHARLSKQLEVLRFKRLLLAGERDTKLAAIRRLKEERAALYERNQDNGSELMQNYHALSRSWECLREAGQSTAALRELASRSHQALHARRRTLLGQLHRHIFTIEKVRPDYYTISGCGLTVCSDAKPGGVSASREAAGAGLAAQCCCVAARILQQPLRYQVKLQGSMSYIVDHLTPQLVDRNIPLYPRERDCALFRYALFLLNVTIAQLLWGVGAASSDVRATLRNLHALLTREHAGASDGHSLLDASKMFGSASSMEGACGGALSHSHCSVVPQNLRSLVAYKTDRRTFNRFKDCADNNSSMSVHIMKHRHSRSVGSYKDDKDHQTLEISSTSIMGSEPSLLILDEAICTSNEVLDLNPSRASLKPHCSESELSKLSESCYDSPVIFNIPDDDENTDQLILKISSNNGDSVTEDNFETICTRIEELCDNRKESNPDTMVTSEKENSNDEETLSNGNEGAVLHEDTSDLCNDET